MSKSYLENILKETVKEVEFKKSKLSLSDIKSDLLDLPKAFPFISTLVNKIKNKKITIIAEIKKASPSKGIIRKDFDPLEIAQSYFQGGADCLSILTNSTFFLGELGYIKKVRSMIDLPILRKDFIIDEFQIYESRVAMADAILLIAAVLSKSQLREYYDLAQEIGLDVLIEVHNQRELESALETKSFLIGVNNRDLKTFEVNLETSINLNKLLPKDTYLISESGIASKEDIDFLQKNNIYGYLIGESFMKEKDPGNALKLFTSKKNADKSAF